ncbi:MAG: glycosyltransferase family 10 [Pedobacter sp.]|uniref:glycosyltransferase family 10 domain-containing protein n=1 Tax=Pedobacter sp. TaxID=1411316 RepID=UPI0033924D60
MKIKFFSDYTTSEDLLVNFKAKYTISDDQLSFTLDNDYDYAVVFNRAVELIKESAKIITIIQEPSWNEVHQIKTFLTGSDVLIIHDPDLFERVHGIKLGGKVIESPSYMFYYDRVAKSAFTGVENIQKEKKLSMIVSSLGSAKANYRKRLALVDKIIESDLNIDIYGRGLDLRDERYKGALDYKYMGLIPYEYSIAIENCNEKNYITEKFADCLLCNTVPIYNGAPNIAEVYDERYFKTIDLNSHSIIEDIRKIISIPAPGTIVNRDIYFNKLNLYDKLKEIIFS